uniref:Transposase n=1 Tax=Panagrolaimus davidi TaxID=227884 RepID=A0A914R0K8_9BILA
MFGDLKTIETSIHKHQAENSQASIAEMRLYTALLVYRLCKLGMNSLYDCARTFKVAVGWIQQTYESMCHRAQALGRFSEVPFFRHFYLNFYKHF